MRTQEYVARRTAEGKSKREIIRCLKRYVAREVYRVLISCGARSSPTGPEEEDPDRCLEQRHLTIGASLG